jgi:4-amino-4-deoxy-L-arabinose transferase-like glycosyltransferase
MPSSVSPQAWLLAIGSSLRVFFFLFSAGNGGDAFARAAITAQWLQHPSLNLDFGGPNWPPLHFWLMALVAQIVPNVLLACRLLSLIAGLASLWLFWKLTRRLYGEVAAILSLIIFVFYSLHIAYATTSSSEETFVALILAGLLGVFSFRASGNSGCLIFGGLSLTAAAGIRYEAWILISGLGLFFLLGQEGRKFPTSEYWKALLAFGVSSGVWPVFWAIRSWARTGNPFFSLSLNRTLVPGQLAIFPEHGVFYELALVPGVVLLTVTPVAVAGTLYGLWLSFRHRKCLDFALLAVFLGIFQMVTIATHGLTAMARYTLTLGTFCAVLAGYGLVELGNRLRLRRQAVVALLSAVMAVNLALIVVISKCSSHFEDKFRQVSPLMLFSVHLEGVAQTLHQRMQPGDRLVIDNFNDEGNLLAAAIGLPLLIGNDRAFMADRQREADLFPFIDTYHPRFAILSGRGTIGSHLQLPSTCSESWILQGMDLRCLYENEIYRVYEITYGQLPNQ